LRFSSKPFEGDRRLALSWAIVPGSGSLYGLRTGSSRRSRVMHAEALIDAALELLRQSRTHVQTNQRLLSETRYRVAAGRRQLNPAFAFEGSSDEEHQALRKSIRDRLASGALFPAGLKIVARSGRGNECVVCRTSIGPADVEYQIPLGET